MGVHWWWQAHIWKKIEIFFLSIKASIAGLFQQATILFKYLYIATDLKLFKSYILKGWVYKWELHFTTDTNPLYNLIDHIQI